MGRVQRLVALLCAIVSLVVLPACSTRIPGPVYVDGNSPLLVVAKGEGMDSLFLTDKISLAPGDVIYSTVIYAGFPDKDNNMYLPFHVSQRIPLRFVGADSTLTDGERQFLFMTLSAARGTSVALIIAMPETPCREQLAKVLNEHEKTLWNLMVASITVQRKAAIGTGATPSLEVMLATEKLEAELSPLLTQLDPGTDSPACPSGRFLFDGVDIPISAIGVEARSIASSVFQFNGTTGVTVPTKHLSSEQFARTAVSQIEFGGASVNELHGIERRWSLADWAQSGICQVDGKRHGAADKVPVAAIRAIGLRTGGFFSSAWYRIKPDGEAKLSVAIGSSGPDRIERMLKGKRESAWDTLSESSLKSLTMADVMAIEWEVDGKPVSLNNCKGR
jgi:hypothetical protein